MYISEYRESSGAYLKLTVISVRELVERDLNCGGGNIAVKWYIGNLQSMCAGQHSELPTKCIQAAYFCP